MQEGRRLNCRYSEGVTLVQRVDTSSRMDEIEGIVVSVDQETSASTGLVQYHIKIDPTNFKVKGKTNLLHEWVGLSKTASEEQVPQGSVLERYLTQIEICVPAAKKAATLKAAFAMLVGKKFRFQRIKLGKEYDGNPAKEYIVPVAAM
jgi:hypothetical protein